MPRDLDSHELPESNRLYSARKFILEREVWHWIENGSVGHFQAHVWTERGEELQLRASVTGNNLQIALYARRSQLVRKWHSHDGHRNPDGETVGGPHKHYPTRTHPQGSYAYPVTDIPDDGIDDALIAFLDECNIDTHEPYQRQIDG